MNPFENFIDSESKKVFLTPKLIGVGAGIGQGKTTLLHTMIYQYLKSGIDVIYFTEEPQHRSIRLMVLGLAGLEEKKLGNISVYRMMSNNFIFDFNKKSERHLEFSNNKKVIITDYDFLFLGEKVFSYKKIKSENTRYVLVEKSKNKSRFELINKEEENPNFRARFITESFIGLAYNFNTHIICSFQTKRTLTDNTFEILNSFAKPFLYSSDLFFLIKKNDNDNEKFTIKTLKTRSDHFGNRIECKIDTNNLTLATIN